MDIAIIGSGTMAQGLAFRFARAGCAVTIGARNRDTARTLAALLGYGIASASIAEAVQRSEIVVLAIPCHAIDEVIGEAGDLSGKIVFDITNPITSDYVAPAVGQTTSVAEELQKRVPKAHIVKAFNTIFAEVLRRPYRDNQSKVQIYYAADDTVAGERAAASIRAIGFQPIYSGKLTRARYLEPLAEFNSHLMRWAGAH